MTNTCDYTMRKGILLIVYLITSIGLMSAESGQYTEIYRSLKGYPVGVLNSLGEKYYQSGAIDSALVCFSIVSSAYIPVAEEKEKLMYAHAYNRCGVIYMHYNSYSKAMNMFLKSLDICEGAAYSAKVYNNMGNLYCFFRDYRMADNYCLKAYILSCRGNDKVLTEAILYNLIGINYYLEDYDKVKHYIKSFKKLNPKNEKLYRYHLYLSNGALSFMQKKYAKALADFKTSLLCADSCSASVKFKYVSLSHISKCFSVMQKVDSALYYMKLGEKVLRSDNFTELRTECFADIASVYSLMGNEKEALAYKKLYLELADSIFNVQEFGRVKDMQFVHEMEKIEKQVSKLSDERVIKDNKIESQQQALRIFIGALIVILTLLVIMYIQVRRLREANLELFHRNLELMESHEELKRQRRQSLVSGIERMDEEGNESAMSESSENKLKYQSSLVNPEEKKRICEAVLDIMDNTQEYCSVSFTLDKLAALINAKPKYISQVINESFNKNFNTFVNEYRIKEIQRRLMDTESYGKYTIVFIAASVGFKSDSNFNAVFKKITGMTPTAYRNMVDKCCRSN